MENSTNTPALEELLMRQLSDWQDLRDNLKAQYDVERSDELTEQIAYCEKQIEVKSNQLNDLMNA